MSKSRKNTRKAKPSRFRQWWANMAPESRRAGVAISCWAVLGILAVVGVVVGMRALQRHVVQKRYAGAKGSVVIGVTSTPNWMPASLARDIADTITPPNASLADVELAKKVYQLAQKNPMIRETTRVEVRPNANGAGGVVEVDLKFRRPLARVRVDGGYVYVDSEGVCLPSAHVPMYVVSLPDRKNNTVWQECYQALGEVPQHRQAMARRIHYVTIDGIGTTSPESGQKWPAEDLEAGLRLIGLIRSRSYYSQITVVDVRNHGCRISRNEPELRMYAQIGRGRPTDIRFGRFPVPGGDIVVSPRKKMWHLDEYAATHDGRLAGINSYLDLRHDNLHISLN